MSLLQEAFELFSKEGVITDEFAEKVHICGQTIPDDILIEDLKLSGYYSPNSRRLKRSFDPRLLDWITIFVGLDGQEKTELSRCLQAISRHSEIKVVGDIRKMEATQLCGICGIGPLRAVFINKVFKRIDA
jgi:hypothetical protein